jgi:hypothetical protein
MRTPESKTCPFCGGRSIQMFEFADVYRARCLRCKAFGPPVQVGRRNALHGAMTAWNKRAKTKAKSS